MFEWLKTTYDNVWAWFKNSGTILLARLTTFIGFIVGVLGAIDWSSLSTYLSSPMGMTNTQLAWMGIAAFLQGIVIEVTRRSNTKEVDNTLISKSTPEVAVKAIKKPGSLKKVN